MSISKKIHEHTEDHKDDTHKKSWRDWVTWENLAAALIGLAIPCLVYLALLPRLVSDPPAVSYAAPFIFAVLALIAAAIG